METLNYLGADSSLLDVLAELLDDLVIDICLQEGLADIVHSIADVRLGDSAPARKRPED